MLRHIIRIEPDLLRLPLLVLAFPFALASHVAGHPDKRRMLSADFYALPVAVFWAAWDGEFVPAERGQA